MNTHLTQETIALVEEVLEKLEPRLRHLARRQIARAPEIVELGADDLYQEMCLKIMEKAYEDNKFLYQKDAFVSQFGLWAALNYIRKTRYKYSNWHVEVETEDEVEVFYCGRAGPEPSSAVEVNEIFDLLDQCPSEYKKVYDLLRLGYTYREAAEILGLSVWNISTRKKRLIRTLQAAYNAPLRAKSTIIAQLT